MHSQIVKYLFIEHLPLLQEGFRNGIVYLSETNTSFKFQGVEIISKDDRLSSIDQLMEGTNFNFIWMNLDFPLQEKHSAFSLLATLKKHSPEACVVVSLQLATVYSLRKTFQKINPHGILDLKDCDQKTIMAAVKAVIAKEIFYSKNILLLLQKFLQTFETMDNADYSILHELDNGTAVTALPEKVFLSHSTILTRRTNLKALFNLAGKTDAHLVQEVKRQGYI